MIYNDKQVQAYTRAGSILVHNPRPDEAMVPSITFNEEHVVDGMHAPGQLEVLPSARLRVEATPEKLAESFNLIHPETGDVIGTATWADLQVLLFSAYLHTAAERDALKAKEPANVPADPDAVTTGDKG
jgi:hypothetical protein